jgi:hypothetical protein
VATLADLDVLALGMPEATKEVSEDGRPAYRVHGKRSASIAGSGPTRAIPAPASGWMTC